MKELKDLINWGWTQQEIAKKAGTSQPTIYRITKGLDPRKTVADGIIKLWTKEKERQSRRKL